MIISISTVVVRLSKFTLMRHVKPTIPQSR